MNGLLSLFCVILCITCGTQAQLLREVRPTHEGHRVSTQSSSESENPVPTHHGSHDDDHDGLFQQILSHKSDRERESYEIQHSRFIGNKTFSNLIVRLKDAEVDDDEEEEEHSFFEPFFEWAHHKKESKYHKHAELKRKGKKKMDEKMKKWNMTGIIQRFYGTQTGVTVLEIDPHKLDFMAAWMTILGDTDVEFAEADMGVDLFACQLTTDWGYHHTRADTAVESLGLSNRTDSRVLVSVIDSGVDYTHPLLRDRIWINEAELNGLPGVDDDGNGFVDDVYGWNFASNTNDVMDHDGHGTHVAGIIAAEASANQDFTGAAPNVLILPCRFTDTPDSGSVSAAIQCIEYAFEMGVDIMSNSWGGAGAYSLALRRAMERASANGNLQITAAGNAGVDNDGSIETATYPASFDTDIIISVAAIDGDGGLSSVSNYGANSTDIGAPGVSIYSTQLDGQLLRMSGTSQATPFVTAGAAVLMGACREQRRECSPLEIKNALLEGAEPDPALRGRVASDGFLDIANAARVLQLVNTTDREELDLCSSGSASLLPSLPLLLICIMFYVFLS